MENDQTTTEYKNDLYELGYIPYFNGITSLNLQDSNLGTCIKNMFLITELENINSYKFIPRIPDHYPLMISIKTIKGKKDSKKYYSFVNYYKLNYEANKLNWNILSEHGDPNMILEFLISNIKTAIRKATVVKKTKKNTPRSIWITKGIMKSCSTKKKYFIKNVIFM